MTVLLAEFSSSKRFLEAARRASSCRYRLLDAYSPFPIEGMDELLNHGKSRIRVVMFICGVATASLAYALEYYSAVVNYPYNSGGRPLDAWPAFMLVPFATGILLAAVFGFATFLLEIGLPRLHDDLFAVWDFARASQDRFLLALARPGNNDEVTRAVELLREAGATAVREVKL